MKKTFTEFKRTVLTKQADYRPFANSVYADQELELLARGKTRRLVHSRPSQHGKSSDTDIFVAFMIGMNPLIRIICATYSQKLARKHSRNVKRILRSPEFCDFFGWTPEFTKDAEDDWQIHWPGQTASATFLARSIESPALGESADLLIIDDPLAGSLAAMSPDRQARAWESINNVLMQRLTPDARVLVIATLWTQGDPSMKLLEAWRMSKVAAVYLNLAALNGDGKASFRWDIRNKEPQYLPAYGVLWPEYRDRAFIQTKQDEMLPEDFECQYQGNPVAGAGTLAPMNCWGEYDELPALEFAIITVDTGLERGDKNDPSCLLCVAQGVNGRSYVLDAEQGRWSQAELIQRTYMFYELMSKRMGARNPDEYRFYVPMIYIEKAAMGRPLFDEIRGRNASGLSFVPVSLVDPALTKLLRARAQSHLIQAGHVSLPRHAPWVPEFKKQWFAFPKWGSGHDEFVDCLAYALKYMPIERQAQAEERLQLRSSAQMEDGFDEFTDEVRGALNFEQEAHRGYEPLSPATQRAWDRWRQK